MVAVVPSSTCNLNTSCIFLRLRYGKACEGEQQTGIIPCSTPIPVRANLGDSVQTLCISVQEMFDTSTPLEFPCLPQAVSSGAFLTILVCQFSAKTSFVSFVAALLLLFLSIFLFCVYPLVVHSLLL